MVKLSLEIQADLENITDLVPVDTFQVPFLYNFMKQCSSCRELHENAITLNRFEEITATNSKSVTHLLF